MGSWTAIAGGERFRFDGLPRLLAAASPRRSGDELAGIAAGSDAERVAARIALADLPLRAFLSEAVVPYEDGRGDAADPRHARRGRLRARLPHDGGPVPRLAAVARGRRRRPRRAVPGPDAGDGGGGVQADAQPGPDRGRRASASVVTAFRSTLGLPGRLATRLQPNHPTDDLRGIAASILDGLLCGSGDAVIGVNPATDSVPNCIAPARHAGRAPGPVRHPDPDLRADPRHQRHRDHAPRRAGGPGVPVDRRHGGRQRRLRRQPVHPARGARRGAGAGPRRAGRRRDVLRDRPGRRALGRGASTAWTSRRWRRGPTRWRAPSGRSSSTPWSASSAPSTCSTASRSSAPGWRTTSAASCSACRWAATSATPTTPRPTATTWTG